MHVVFYASHDRGVGVIEAKEIRVFGHLARCAGIQLGQKVGSIPQEVALDRPAGVLSD